MKALREVKRHLVASPGLVRREPETNKHKQRKSKVNAKEIFVSILTIIFFLGLFAATRRW
jgi:hypothetical protein